MAEPGSPTRMPVQGWIVRFDPATGKVLSRWAGGGDPVGIALGGAYLWTVNGAGDHSEPEVAANHALQLDTRTGKMVQRYAVANPAGIAAANSHAWAVSGTPFAGRAWVIMLQRGKERQVTQLPSGPALSSGPSVVRCGPSLYVVTISNNAKRLRITRLAVSTGRVDAAWTIDAGGVTSLACAPSGVVVTVASGHDGGVWTVRTSSPHPTGPFGSRYSSGAVVLHGVVWIVSGSTPRLAQPTVAGYAWPTGRFIGQWALPAGTPGPPLATSASTFWIWNDHSQLLAVQVSPTVSQR
jgi:hypothetical protein